jgi:hypothetical protein
MGTSKPIVEETNVVHSAGSKASLSVGLMVPSHESVKGASSKGRGPGHCWLAPQGQPCVFITAGPIIKLCAGGEGDSEGHVL